MLSGGGSLVACPDLTGVGAAAPLMLVKPGLAPWSSGTAVAIARRHVDAGLVSSKTHLWQRLSKYSNQGAQH